MHIINLSYDFMEHLIFTNSADEKDLGKTEYIGLKTSTSPLTQFQS